MTRYVQRDGNGEIIGHFANPQPYATEAVEDNDEEVAAWEAARAAAAAEGPTVAELQAQIAAMQAALDALTGGGG